jgi:hypothetical protein
VIGYLWLSTGSPPPQFGPSGVRARRVWVQHRLDALPAIPYSNNQKDRKVIDHYLKVAFYLSIFGGINMEMIVFLKKAQAISVKFAS